MKFCMVGFFAVFFRSIDDKAGHQYIEIYI